MFELAILVEYAAENGLRTARTEENRVAVDLGHEYILVFENSLTENDTFIFFEGSDGGWHSHGDLFADDDGSLQLVPVDILESLIDGRMLVQKTVFADGVTDIQLTDASSKPNLETLESGEEVTFYRVAPSVRKNV